MTWTCRGYTEMTMVYTCIDFIVTKRTHKKFKSVVTKDRMELRFTITRDLADDRNGENTLPDKV